MIRLSAVVLLFLALLLSPLSAHAYIWRCHQPNGQVMWTGQPAATDDCEEYDPIFNPSAAPPVVQSPPLEVVPASTSLGIVVPFPPNVVTPPPPYAVPYPYPYPYYSYYYPYGPGVYIAPPAFVFRFGFGLGRGHGPHFRHHWR